MCRKFQDTGYCPYGSKCNFAHGSHQMRKLDAPSYKVQKTPSVSDKFKQQPCLVFHNGGVCHLGSKCSYIHYHTKYRSNTCMDYYNSGACRKGSSCPLKHG